QRTRLAAEGLDHAADGAGAKAPGERALLERRLLLGRSPVLRRRPLGGELAAQPAVQRGGLVLDGEAHDMLVALAVPLHAVEEFRAVGDAPALGLELGAVGRTQRFLAFLDRDTEREPPALLGRRVLALSIRH